MFSHELFAVQLSPYHHSLSHIADVWNSETSGGGRDTVYLSRSTGEAIKYVTRFEGQEVVLEFQDFSAYDEPDQVPNARLSDEEKESCKLIPDDNYGIAQCPPPPSRKRCEGCQDQDDIEDLIEALIDAFLEDMSNPETGLVEESSGSDVLDPFSFSTEKEYEMKGSEEEQAVVNGLKSFQPGMVGRKMFRVRNQSNCGSCYSFSAAHTITSSYAQENPESDLLVFSPQHFMNCMPLIKGRVGLGGTGCWGASHKKVIDMVVYYGGKVPVDVVEPYLGVQSHCNLEQEMVDTGKVRLCLCAYCFHDTASPDTASSVNPNSIGITGYSPITTVEQMKNALYFRGDVSVGYQAKREDKMDLSGDGKVPLPSDNMELHEQAYLGEGFSYPYLGSANHAVAIVGWGPCQVTHVSIAECVEVAI